MSAKIINGYVLSRVNKETDAIIKLICPFGFLSFFAMGVNKPNSKNNVALQLGNFIECEVFLARAQDKLSKLKKATIIDQFDLINKPYSVNLLKAIKFSRYVELNSLDFFAIFDQFIKNIHKNSYFALTWFLYRLLKILGYAQVNDKCIECSSNQNIIEIDISKGGFICNKHNKNITNINTLKNFLLLSNDINEYIKLANDFGDKELKDMFEKFIMSVTEF